MIISAQYNGWLSWEHLCVLVRQLVIITAQPGMRLQQNTHKHNHMTSKLMQHSQLKSGSAFLVCHQYTMLIMVPLTSRSEQSPCNCYAGALVPVTSSSFWRAHAYLLFSTGEGGEHSCIVYSSTFKGLEKMRRMIFFSDTQITFHGFMHKVNNQRGIFSLFCFSQRKTEKNKSESTQWKYCPEHCCLGRYRTNHITRKQQLLMDQL